MDNFFLGKKILFICPKTFNYESEIKSELELLGSEVTYFNDKPFNNIFLIILLRVAPKLLWGTAKNIFLEKLSLYKNDKFDIIFIIKGEGVSPNLLRWLKINYSQTKLVLYLWDSILNVKNVVEKFSFFDKIASFDPVDCEKYKNIKYRPLFFLDSYKNKYETAGNGLFFVGTLNGDRRVVLSKVNNFVKDQINFEYWFFIRSNFEMFLLNLHKAINKFLGIKYYEIPSNRLIRKAMTASQINSKIESCLAVLDIHHPKQTGLTMRTFEVLASGKKLVTTNKSIQNEIFFDSSIIQIIDREKPEIDLNFFNNDCNRMPDLFFKHYSCKGWLLDIFCDIY